MASSGPTSAAVRTGARCQTTTRTSAAEAISENGIAVQRTFERISATNRAGPRDVRDTAAVISSMFTTYCTPAQTATAAVRAATLSEPIGAISQPAAAAAIAKTEAL